eukprot:CAMPEP_0180547110 /NCGR_PEP_ID=MMETSP1036_2-20121128/70913_1 /TAXON_ID=632150 /ORGANISM="Azadinium spinosum, Strain 3D9" /LENGTH=82 /DNA_ID=CAMNT_0022562227 /DNA_START=3 /DNA_END=248 /DNA_ORIENTATION=+
MTKEAYQSLFSIGLGIGLTLLKLSDAIVVQKLSTMVTKKVEEELGANDQLRPDLRPIFEKFRRNRIIIYAGFATMTVALLYA